MKKIILLVVLVIGFLNMKAQPPIQVTAPVINSNEDTINVPIFMDNVDSMASLSMTLNFDNNTLDFVGVTNTATFSSGVFTNVINGSLLIAWFNLTPVTFASDTLAILQFTRGIGCFSHLVWDTITPGANQITNIGGQTLPTQYNNGLVSFLNSAAFPVLELPLDNATDEFIFNTLQWKTTDCAVNYKLNFSDQSNFSNLLIDTLLGDTIFPVALQPNTTYFWKVAKVDTQDSLFWSNTFSFTTSDISTVQVSMPTLMLFDEASVTVPVVIDSFIDVADFKLVLDYDTSTIKFTGFADPLAVLTGMTVQDSSGSIYITWAANAAISFPLDTLVKLNFDRLACSSTISVDVTSSYFKYLFDFLLPSAYNDGGVTFINTTPTTLISPLDNAHQVFIQPQLTWASPHCTDDYRLQIGLDPALNTLFLDSLVGLDTTFIPQNFSDSMTYYWRVGRIDGTGMTHWSTIWSFTTEEVLFVTTKAHSETTYGNAVTIPITIDSLRNATAIDIRFSYDTTGLQFTGFSDTTELLTGVELTDTMGQIWVQWDIFTSLSNLANIDSDTIIAVHFMNKNSCFSSLTWDPMSSYTHLNNNINIFSTYQDAFVSFLAVSEPTLIAPANGTTTERDPVLTWQEASCSFDQRLQIATDANFVNIVKDSTNLSGTEVFATFLNGGTTYFWRVGKIDTEGIIYWSDTLQFTTGADYQSTINLQDVQTPQSSVIIPVTVDSLYWLTGVDWLVTYNTADMTFTGFSNPLFSNITVTDNGGSLHIQWSDTIPQTILVNTFVELNFDNIASCLTPLIWDMNSALTFVSPDINQSSSYIDGEIAFVITTPANLISPPDQIVGFTTMPTFTWMPEDCTVEYLLQVDLNNNFSNPILDAGGLVDTFFSTAGLLNDTTYYWRVGRVDDLDSVYWSTTFEFTTQLLSANKIKRPTLQTEVFPNPFSDYTNIAYTLPESGKVRILIYNQLGQLLETLVNDYQSMGDYQIPFAANDLPNGFYFYYLEVLGAHKQYEANGTIIINK